MGQRLTTLKTLLKSKKENNMDNSAVFSDTDCKLLAEENLKDFFVTARSNIQSTDLTTKNEETHQHFETIYNSNLELATDVSDTLDVESLQPNDTRVEMEYKTHKTKSKFCKKRSHDTSSNKKKKHYWVLKFNSPRLKNSNSVDMYTEADTANRGDEAESCTCPSYRRTDNQSSINSSSLPIFIPKQPENDNDVLGDGETVTEAGNSNNVQNAEPVIDLSKFNPIDYPIEDCDEQARLERAREIAEGVDPPPGFSPKQQIELVCHSDVNFDKLKALFHSAISLSALSQLDVPKSVHTQVDYIHCLVPNLFQITSCSFYWGKMDRYEAERLLENRSEGTFLLRDSAQEEHLFSVSFRKYGRSLHARIEQWNHRFSFDSHDPGVYSSNTVCGLIEHYKDPTCCMFFEPLLTIPLHRNFTFSLQHLCRAVICDNLTYDSVSYLRLPKSLKTYLKEYHYKQRVRVRKFETEP